MSLLLEAAIKLSLVSVVLSAISVLGLVMIYFYILQYLPRWLGGVVSKCIIELYRLAKVLKNQQPSLEELKPYGLMVISSSTITTIVLWPYLIAPLLFLSVTFVVGVQFTTRSADR